MTSHDYINPRLSLLLRGGKISTGKELVGDRKREGKLLFFFFFEGRGEIIIIIIYFIFILIFYLFVFVGVCATDQKRARGCENFPCGRGQHRRQVQLSVYVGPSGEISSVPLRSPFFLVSFSLLNHSLTNLLTYPFQILLIS